MSLNWVDAEYAAQYQVGQQVQNNTPAGTDGGGNNGQTEEQAE